MPNKLINKSLIQTLHISRHERLFTDSNFIVVNRKNWSIVVPQQRLKLYSCNVYCFLSNNFMELYLSSLKHLLYDI